MGSALRLSQPCDLERRPLTFHLLTCRLTLPLTFLFFFFSPLPPLRSPPTPSPTSEVAVLLKSFYFLLLHHCLSSLSSFFFLFAHPIPSSFSSSSPPSSFCDFFFPSPSPLSHRTPSLFLSCSFGRPSQSSLLWPGCLPVRHPLSVSRFLCEKLCETLCCFKAPSAVSRTTGPPCD